MEKKDEDKKFGSGEIALYVFGGLFFLALLAPYWKEVLLVAGGGSFLIVTSVLGFLIANIVPILLILILLVLLAR